MKCRYMVSDFDPRLQHLDRPEALSEGTLELQRIASPGTIAHIVFSTMLSWPISIEGAWIRVEIDGDAKIYRVIEQGSGFDLTEVTS